jgi:hypothetical protein
MHLGTGRVTSDVNAICDPQLLIRPKLAIVEEDADRVEAEVSQGRRATDGEEDLVTFNGRAVRHIDGVSTAGAGASPDTRGMDTGPDVDAVMPQGGVERCRAARMVTGVDPIVR